MTTSLNFSVEGLKCGWRTYRTQHIWRDGRTTPLALTVWGPTGADYPLDDLEHIQRCLGTLPCEWRHYAQEVYRQKFAASGRQVANLWLLELAELARSAPLRLTADDDELTTKAKASAERCARLDLTDCQTVAEALDILRPKARTEAGQHARYKDPQWWRRRLRARHCQAVEQVGRELGLTSAHRQLYITDTGLRLIRERKRRNRAILQEWEAVNELGEAYTLADLADRSVSNPQLRRNELMTRIAGTEQLARDIGHSALFATITCPSRFHATLARSGRRNPRFDGATPRDGARYLNRVWANARRWFEESGIAPYGIRVREPQQDGTPHDHYLLFVPSDQEETVIRCLRTWALKDSPNEPGAQKHRFDLERIDYRRGTATGYIAKYISKNIDGYAVDADLYGQDAKRSAERAQAWSSIWGIKQFSFFGSPPVGVWRELRRLDAGQSELAEPLKRAAEAADAGKWAEFIAAMGGIGARRATQPIRLLKVWSDEPGRYGEAKGEHVIGVEAGTLNVITRLHQWTINRVKGKQQCETATSFSASTAAAAATKSAPGSTHATASPVRPHVLGVDRRSAIKATATGRGEAVTGIRAGTVLRWSEAKVQPPGKPGKPLFLWEVEEAPRQRGGAAPWSPVNNCTAPCYRSSPSAATGPALVSRSADFAKVTGDATTTNTNKNMEGRHAGRSHH